MCQFLLDGAASPGGRIFNRVNRRFSEPFRCFYGAMQGYVPVWQAVVHYHLVGASPGTYHPVDWHREPAVGIHPQRRLIL
jgi:hypothetical protein